MPRKVRLSAPTAKSSLSRRLAAAGSAWVARHNLAAGPDTFPAMGPPPGDRPALPGNRGRGAQGPTPPVEFDALRRRQPVPERAAVDVDEIVGDQPAITVERLLPVD